MPDIRTTVLTTAKIAIAVMIVATQKDCLYFILGKV